MSDEENSEYKKRIYIILDDYFCMLFEKFFMKEGLNLLLSDFTPRFENSTTCSFFGRGYLDQDEITRHYFESKKQTMNLLSQFEHFSTSKDLLPYATGNP